MGCEPFWRGRSAGRYRHRATKSRVPCGERRRLSNPTIMTPRADSGYPAPSVEDQRPAQEHRVHVRAGHTCTGAPEGHTCPEPHTCTCGAPLTVPVSFREVRCTWVLGREDVRAHRTCPRVPPCASPCGPCKGWRAALCRQQAGAVQLSAAPVDVLVPSLHPRCGAGDQGSSEVLADGQ
jgi:hypothetical protein